MDDIKSYLCYSALPFMPVNIDATSLLPPDGHKSHRNYLCVRPEMWRRLESIYPLGEASMDQAATSCTPKISPSLSCWSLRDTTTGIDNNIPDFPFDIYEMGSREISLTVPCLTTETTGSPCDGNKKPSENITGFDITCHSETRIRWYIPRIASWLDTLPLQTVQSIVHLLYPQTRKGRFILTRSQDEDADIFQHFTWSTTDFAQPDCRNSAVIAFQPPWILSEQDIREFSECRSVRSSVVFLYSSDAH